MASGLWRVAAQTVDEVPGQARARRHAVDVLSQEIAGRYPGGRPPARLTEVVLAAAVSLLDRRPRVAARRPLGGGPRERERRAQHAHEVAGGALLGMAEVPPREGRERHRELARPDAGHFV